ncbi:phospholipid phosphatase 5 isoform X2 [Sylvia atricapilla]|uniref:phospholipid phosphatase 5 isoform X2 n=1 Tax=Sylvia atricapilla TaxID=48155 RepID=UPI00339B7FF9
MFNAEMSQFRLGRGWGDNGTPGCRSLLRAEPRSLRPGGSGPAVAMRRAELAAEIALRALLLATFGIMEFLPPFQRVVQPEEMWLYKNPYVEVDRVPTLLMFFITFLSPLLLIVLARLFMGADQEDTREACLGHGLTSSTAASRTGVPTPSWCARGTAAGSPRAGRASPADTLPLPLLVLASPPSTWQGSCTALFQAGGAGPCASVPSSSPSSWPPSSACPASATTSTTGKMCWLAQPRAWCSHTCATGSTTLP